MVKLLPSVFTALTLSGSLLAQTAPSPIVLPDLNAPPQPLPQGIQGQPSALIPPPRYTPPGKPQDTPVKPDLKLPLPEQRIKLDRGSVLVRNTSGGWILMGGQQVVRNFGEDRVSAEEAAKAIRDLGPTEWATIGTSRPVVGYAISEHNQALTTVPSRAVNIDLTSVKAEQTRGVWILRDATNMLLNFGLEQASAEQAAAVVRKYGYNRVGHIGRAGMEPSFSFFYTATDVNNTIQPTANTPANAMQQLQYAQQEQQLQRTGIPVPGLGLVGERITIEARKLETRRDGGDWVIVHGTEVLGRFGTNEWIARDALRTLQDMKVTEYCRLGSSGFQFFLVNGKAPTNVPFNAQGQRFDPKALVVKPVDKSFGVFEGQGRMVFTASTKQEAEQMVRVVQGFGFEQQCQIGQTNAASIKFLAKVR